MSIISTILKRELRSYFLTPIAYVFIVVFLLLNGICTFYFGDFWGRAQADLVSFFSFHPWIYAIFIPAISMRLWAEERKTGSIEILFTLPITITQAILGKFLAGLVFISVALVLTMPMWILVNYLGKPDNGVIAVCYLGSLLMASCFLAIGAAVSALTKNQVIAFVLSLLLCLLVNLLGFPVVIDQLRLFMPNIVIDTLRNLSFLTNFDTMSRGIIELRSIVYFITLTAFFLFANAVFIENKRAD
jgi:ABC-2 type transport system permease protein